MGIMIELLLGLNGITVVKIWMSLAPKLSINVNYCLFRMMPWDKQERSYRHLHNSFRKKENFAQKREVEIKIARGAITGPQDQQGGSVCGKSCRMKPETKQGTWRWQAGC